MSCTVIARPVLAALPEFYRKVQDGTIQRQKPDGREIAVSILVDQPCPSLGEGRRWWHTPERVKGSEQTAGFLTLSIYARTPC